MATTALVDWVKVFEVMCVKQNHPIAPPPSLIDYFLSPRHYPYQARPPAGAGPGGGAEAGAGEGA